MSNSITFNSAAQLVGDKSDVGERQQPSEAASSLRLGSRWIDSIWIGLSISLIVGLLYTLILMGPAPLNPHNTGWMLGDPAQYYISWELLRQDPHWHWPLTYTTRLGYPFGENAALADPNSLFVILLKPFSRWLPDAFQYFGAEVIIACTLLFFFSIRLFRLVLGANPVGVFLCSLFFLTAPALAWNLTRHYTMSCHWLLVAALVVYVQAQQEAVPAFRRFVFSALILAAIAIATNPYLTCQVFLVLAATAISLLWQRRLSPRKAMGFMVALIGTCVLVAYALGLVIAGGKGYGKWGYRVYSLNLLAPFDPYTYSSIVSRLLPRFPHFPMDVGCSYLGGGIIFLALLLLVLFAVQPRKRPALNSARVVPLLLCCAVLTLMALSTRIMIGTATLVDLDPKQHLTPLLSALTESLCLFWTPYYVILMVVVAAPFLLFRKFAANWLLAIMLVVQIVDVAPLLAWAHTRVVPSKIDDIWKPAVLKPLTSPIWSSLGSTHKNLVVLPAWQCDHKLTPGGLDGYRIFGFLAVEQKMTTNSYRSARYTEVNYDFHCRQAIAELATQPLSPDTAYVVTPALAEFIAQGPTGPGKCHAVDGFVLCSSKLDFAQVASGGKAVVAGQ